MNVRPRGRRPREHEPKANRNAQEARRTLITQLMAQGVYQPKLILAELGRRNMRIGRTQLYKDMSALDVEQDKDFRNHRKRFRHVVFNRLLLRDRQADNTIADIEEAERTNRATLASYIRVCEAADALGEVRPNPPKLLAIDSHAKMTAIGKSIEALREASTLAGLASSIVEVDAGDLAAWAALARDGGLDAVQKRAAKVFPEYERIRKQRSADRGD